MGNLNILTNSKFKCNSADNHWPHLSSEFWDAKPRGSFGELPGASELFCPAKSSGAHRLRHSPPQ
ncbi:hypothetical protein N7491_006778 [Penicillium cf. griseofulvum]|uniref:Uncharacterized protein n=1 Tax=Penicillium cf. griseofulvum TaxID=2972120 RepID=A0A9W9IUL6_9EURO|nr:hypothetical protein N7472_010193 [Penicillium cf. griseofulvum]KAJ5429762.1 hypothetical protein N7491_006778 [Penicillium cf. griseofulvum]KAJ5436469.1 hypothetical protein N7445_007354 [Penicillium cf. griseofulvum]